MFTNLRPVPSKLNDFAAAARRATFEFRFPRRGWCLRGRGNWQPEGIYPALKNLKHFFVTVVLVKDFSLGFWDFW